MSAHTILTSIIAFLIAAALTSWVRTHARGLRLVQDVDRRSSHTQPTPTGGGTAIVLSATVIIFTQSYLDTSRWFQILITSIMAFPLAIAGFIDDRGSLSFKVRLAIQVLVVVLFLFYLRPILGEVMSWGRGIRALGYGLIFLFSGVWWINLFNFMDGIDGIAAMESLFLLITGAIMVYGTKHDSFASPLLATMIIICAATLGFLIYNWAPARIFMGDTGSTWLAFMIFALALYSLVYTPLNVSTWLILGASFICDATVTLCVRFLRHERLHEAHRSHASSTTLPPLGQGSHSQPSCRHPSRDGN